MTFVKVNNPVQKSINQFFDEFLNEIPSTWNRNVQNVFNPPVNILETKDAYHMELNAPGRNKEDFKINIENGLLTISFDKKAENVSEDAKSVRKEFSFESFKRSFNIDEKIQADNIQAKYENGVLKLYLPKKEEVKENPKQISIQ